MAQAYEIAPEPQQVTMARMQSYTGKAVLTLILYMFLWIPGLIANILFVNEANRMQRIAGQSLPGVGFLKFLLWAAIAATVLFFLLVLALMGALAGA
jgi:hypothetical protein